MNIFRKDYSAELDTLVTKFSNAVQKKRTGKEIEEDSKIITRIQYIVGKRINKLGQNTIEINIKKIKSLFELESIKSMNNQTVFTNEERKILTTIYKTLGNQLVESFGKNDKNTLPHVPVTENKQASEMEHARKKAKEPSDSASMSLPPESPSESPTASHEIKDESTLIEEAIPSSVQEQNSPPVGGPPMAPIGNIPPPPPPPGFGKKIIEKRFENEPEPLPDNWIKDLKDPVEGPVMKEKVITYAEALKKAIEPIQRMLEEHEILTEIIAPIQREINFHTALIAEKQSIYEEAQIAFNNNTTYTFTGADSSIIKFYTDQEHARLNKIQKENGNEPLSENLRFSVLFNKLGEDIRTSEERIKEEKKALEEPQMRLNNLEEKKSGEVPFKDFKDLLRKKRILVRQSTSELAKLDKKPSSKGQAAKVQPEVKKQSAEGKEPDLDWYNSVGAMKKINWQLSDQFISNLTRPKKS